MATLGEKPLTILLFTDQYPLELVSETFLRDELRWLSATWGERLTLHIFPWHGDGIPKQPVPKGTTIHPPLLSRRWGFRLGCLLRLLVQREFWQFIGESLRLGPLGLRYALPRFKHLLAAQFGRCAAMPVLRGAKGDLLLYGYWFMWPALTCAMLRRATPHAHAFARAHGYEIRTNPKLVPLRHSTVKQLNLVACVAKAHVKALAEQVPTLSDRLINSPLAIETHYPTAPLGSIPPEGVWPYVTCSDIIPIKRVELIFEFLTKLSESIPPEERVEWQHYGATLEQIETFKSSIAPILVSHPNLSLTLHGSVDNAIFRNALAQLPGYTFINLSTHEGMPITIKEAGFAGMPSIATAVGGTGELVDESVGEALSPTPTAEEFISAAKRVRANYCQLASNMRKRVISQHTAEGCYPPLYQRIFAPSTKN